MLARELVEQRVSVIAAVGGDLVAWAAKNATATIPIVFIIGSDPAKADLVASMNRPGGNATGVSLYSLALEQKKLEMLREIVPPGAAFAALLNRNSPFYEALRID